MDSLGVRILRELAQGTMVLPGRPGLKPSLREVSRKLGAPPATVRYHVMQMYRKEIIKGSSVIPNPNLLGMRAGAFTVDVPSFQDKRDVVQRLGALEGVGFFHDFVGSLVWVVFFYGNDQDLSNKLKLMEEIAGTQGLLSHVPYPPCSATLNQAEAALMLRLVERGFDSYGGLAKELGVSARTLDRRVSKLVSESAVLSLPAVDYHKMSGSVPADLIILFSDLEEARASPRRIMPLVEDVLVLAALWDVVGMCSLVLPSVAAADSLAQQVEKVHGVVKARVEIVKDHVVQANRLRVFVERWMNEEGFKFVPIPTAKTR